MNKQNLQEVYNEIEVGDYVMLGGDLACVVEAKNLDVILCHVLNGRYDLRLYPDGTINNGVSSPHRISEIEILILDELSDEYKHRWYLPDKPTSGTIQDFNDDIAF